MEKTTIGYGADSSSSPLVPIEFPIRELRDDDVHIKVLYCGICHSDIHVLKNEWNATIYPCTPGHEIAGIVAAVGSKVSKFNIGDHVGVGCMVDSCSTCEYCKEHNEHYCFSRVKTYNTAVEKNCQGHTRGGYAKDIVCKESFVLDLKDLPLDKAGPLLCAGITTYSPIKFYGMDRPGRRVGVAGLGGLGHVAVLMLKAFGALPVVISRSISKKEDALKLGAVDFILSTDVAEMKKHAGSLHGIIDTISAPRDINAFIDLLAYDAVLCQVGLPPHDAPIPTIRPSKLVNRRRGYVGSMIGGIKETQEMLDFCAKHNVLPITELVAMDQVNEAIQKTIDSDVKFRFVLDVAKMKI